MAGEISNDVDLTSDPNKQYGLFRIALQKLMDYIVLNVAGLSEEDNQSSIKECLQPSAKLIEAFVQDPQSNLIVINQLKDDSTEEASIRYIAVESSILTAVGLHNVSNTIGGKKLKQVFGDWDLLRIARLGTYYLMQIISNWNDFEITD